MDALAAISVVMSIASSKIDVPVLKALAEFKREEVVATRLMSLDHSWRIQAGNQSVLLNQHVGDEEFDITYESLLAHQKLCPELAPVPYCFDREQHATVLQDFADYDVLSNEIEASKVDLLAINLLGSRLGLVHKNSYFSSNSIIVRDLQQKFRSNSRVNQMIDDQFVVTFGEEFVSKLKNEEIKAELSALISSSSILERVASLKKMILSKHECLSHGFMSTASIGVKHGDVKIVEGFGGTFLGPCSYDLAVLLADFIAFYHKHMLTEQDNDSHRQVAYKMIDASSQMVDAYFEAMRFTVSDDRVVDLVQASRVMSDVAGICGVVLIARVVRGSCVDREDAAGAKSLETLQSGVRLLNAAHRIDSVGLLLNIALMLTF